MSEGMFQSRSVLSIPPDNAYFPFGEKATELMSGARKSRSAFTLLIMFPDATSHKNIFPPRCPDKAYLPSGENATVPTAERSESSYPLICLPVFISHKLMYGCVIDTTPDGHSPVRTDCLSGETAIDIVLLLPMVLTSPPVDKSQIFNPFPPVMPYNPSFEKATIRPSPI